MKATFKRYPIRKLLITTTILAVALFSLSRISFPGMFKMWELKTIDFRFQFRQLFDKAPQDAGYVVQVNVDEYAYEISNKNMWSRAQHGDILLAMQKAGAKFIGVDFFYSGYSTPEFDQRLLDVVDSTGNCILPILFQTNLIHSKTLIDYKKSVEKHHGPNYEDLTPVPQNNSQLIKAVGLAAPPLENLWSKAAGLGFVNMVFDPDGVIRKYPMIISVGDRLFPSFALQLVCKYLDYPVDKLEIVPGKYIKLGGVVVPGSDESRDIEIPIDCQGMIYINYIGPWTENIEQVFSAGDIIRYADDPIAMEDYFKGKLAIFAEVSNRSGDFAAVPVDSYFPRSMIYSNVINSILTDDYIRETGLLTDTLIFMLITVLILLMCIYLKIWYFSAFYLILLLFYSALNCYVFIENSLLLPATYTAIPATIIFLYDAAFKFYYQEKNRLVIETSFKAYMPPEILKKIEEDSNFLTPGGESKEVIVIFADIRKFSIKAEELTPEELIELLNQYYKILVGITFKHGGTIDKFTGDEIMVLFGAPESRPDDHLRALKMVLEWSEGLKKFNEKFDEGDIRKIEIGTGINFGKAVAGNIGSDMRMDYSVLGDVINKAARIVSSAGPGELKMGESYYNLVKEYIDAEGMEPFKGKEGEMKVKCYLLKGLVKEL